MKHGHISRHNDILRELMIFNYEVHKRRSNKSCDIRKIQCNKLNAATAYLNCSPNAKTFHTKYQVAVQSPKHLFGALKAGIVINLPAEC